MEKEASGGEREGKIGFMEDRTEGVVRDKSNDLQSGTISAERMESAVVIAL